jgi:hypothetical protein
MKGIEYTGAVIAVCGTCWLTAHIWLKKPRMRGAWGLFLLGWLFTMIGIKMPKPYDVVVVFGIIASLLGVTLLLLNRLKSPTI